MADRKFIEEFLRAVNDYRSIHQVAPLRHNATISNISQRWADNLARTGLFQHNPQASFNGQPLGENCAMKWSSNSTDYRGQEVADKWYDEIRNYDFVHHKGSNTGHFTQLVWKESREIGIGRAQSRDGKWFVVANFFPAGNFVGQNAKNVFPAVQQRLFSNGHGQADSSVGRQKAAPARVQRLQKQQLPSPFRPISRSPSSSSLSDSDHEPQREVKSSTHHPQRPQLVAAPLRKPAPAAQSAAPGAASNPNENGSVLLQRTTETKTENGFTIKNVVETRRDHSGKISKVTTETMERQTTGENAYGTPAVKQPSILNASDDSEFTRQVLDRHNIYRQRHGNTNKLTLNSELSRMAERWAQYLAGINTLQHSNTKYRDFDLGENIGLKTSHRGGKSITGDEVVNKWYDEVQTYNFNWPDLCAQPCGHFTQVVWKGSQEIGVGRAFADQGLKVFVVCYYYPAGNIIGRFKDNVFPAF